MRRSLFGSNGWFGSVYSSRLPLPLVSRMNGVQPCDFCSSPVSSYIFMLIHPAAPLWAPPALAHSVLLASKPNCTWWVGKHVSIILNCCVFGSYIVIWRPEALIGNTFADGWLEPARQNAGVAFGRILEANQIRAFSSKYRLCGLVWASQIFSSPKYGEAANIGAALSDGVFGSRTGSFTSNATFFTGSSTGTLSVEFSVAPKTRPLAFTVGLRLSLTVASCR